MAPLSQVQYRLMVTACRRAREGPVPRPAVHFANRRAPATIAHPRSRKAPMPEEIEIDTDKLRETIDEEIEKDGGNLLRGIALTTAMLAALAAIASLQAGATVNEALVL